MLIKLNYVIPFRDAITFSHLQSNKLTVTIDTAMMGGIDEVDMSDEVDSLIADAVLREYRICLTRVHHEAIPRYSDIMEKVKEDLLKRRWCEDFERATHYEEMMRATIGVMTSIVKDAYKKADSSKKAWENV